MADISTVSEVAQYAGPLALAAFAGTLMGGLALSFFWKAFGPWAALKEAHSECQACHDAREEDAHARARVSAELAEAKASLQILSDAMRNAGFSIQLGPSHIANQPPPKG